MKKEDGNQPSAPDQLKDQEIKIDETFLKLLHDIDREVAWFDATRTESDGDAKRRALDVIKELETMTDLTKRESLFFELSKQIGLFDASKKESDRNAKLKALELVRELKNN